MARNRIEGLAKVHVPSEGVFVGQDILNENWVGTVVTNADLLKRDVFNLSPAAKDLNGAVNVVLTEINTVTGRSFLSAEEVVMAVEGEPDNKDLQNGQRMLAEIVFLGLRDSELDKFRGALLSGSVDKIEAVLPDRLKKIAREVRGLLITNSELKKSLDNMDAVADIDGWEDMPPTDGERLGLLSQVLGEVQGLGFKKDNPDIGQYRLVVRSLRSQIAKINQRESVSGDDAGGFDALLREIERLRSAGDKVGVPGEGGGMALGAAEAYKAVEQLAPLTDVTFESVFGWAVQVVDSIAREQLFFAGAGWQQFGPFMEREVRKVCSEKRVGEREKMNLVEVVRSVLATRLYEETMNHADGAISIMLKTLPQAGIFDKNEWNKDRREVLLEHPLISYFLENTFDLIEVSPSETLALMKNSETMNILAEDMARSVFSNQEVFDGMMEQGFFKDGDDLNYLQSMARTALSVFMVDHLPDVIMFINDDVVENGKASRFNDLATITKQKRKLDSARMVGDVTVYDSSLNKRIEVGHVLFGLRRPVDIYRVNRVWNEVVLQEAEDALLFLGEQLFYRKEKSNGGDVERFARFSDLSLKTLDRYDAMVSAVFGGTQAEALNSFKDLPTGLAKLQKLLNGNDDMADLGGAIAGKLIKVKVMALLAENADGFLNNLTRALALERTSVPKEIGEALGAVAGSAMDTQFGFIKQAVANLGFNFIGVKDLNDAINMLLTESPNPNDAARNLRFKEAAMFLKAIVDIGAESAGKPKKK